jgi:hypothetical protein
MLRKLTAAVAALFVVAGFGLAAAAPAQAKGVLPVHGSYTGKDHANRHISFTFSGNQITKFTVGHHVIGGAHVSHGMWHETCHNGYCTKGQWQLDFHVVGYWRNPGGHWTAFSASAPQPPQQGDFMGRDHQGNFVHVSFNGTRVHDFTIEGYGDFPDAHVSHGAWHETCSHAGWCYRGRFQGPHTVVGEWRTRGSVWHAWEAHAYSA